MVPVQFLWLSLYVHPSFSIILQACATFLQPHLVFLPRSRPCRLCVLRIRALSVSLVKRLHAVA